MPAALLSKNILKHVIGRTRLQRLLRAGWLKPVEHSSRAVLFDPHDVHKALRLLERRFCPPDQVEVARIRASELKHGRAYVRKGRSRPQPPGLDAIELDFSAYMATDSVQSEHENQFVYPKN